MCGIVGLQLKRRSLYPRLGAWLTPMLLAMSERGPDSAGIALYEDGPADGAYRYSLRGPGPDYDWDGFLDRLDGTLGPHPTLHRAADAAILTALPAPEEALPALKRIAPELHIWACGQALEIYKDVGSPADICRRYGNRGAGRLSRAGPHPHGHGIGRDHRPLPSVRRRPGHLPGPQRHLLQLRPRPSQPDGRRDPL